MDASAACYGIGYCSGTTDVVDELSPAGLAAAVWGALGADFNAAGTMGNKLNTASSGGVDLDALAALVWSSSVRSLTGAAAADVRYVNGVLITGTDVEGDTWGPA